MRKELVEHLRKADGIGRWTKAMHDAADLIEQQAARIEMLREALTMAINHYADVGSDHWNMFDHALSTPPPEAA